MKRSEIWAQSLIPVRHAKSPQSLAILRRRPWVAGLFRTTRLAGDGRAHCSPIGPRVCASPSSPPGFPGMTFSLGNHFLRASTAIFNFNSFMKSCFARVNTPSDTFLRAEQRRRRAVHVVSSDKLQTEQSSTAAGCPQRLSKHRERTCMLLCASRLLSCFQGTVLSQINCLTEPYPCVWG